MEWKDIIDYEGFYQVSEYGDIKSIERYVPHRGRLRLIKERILKPSTDKDGYKIVILQKSGVAKTFKVHRVVAFAFIGHSDLTVNHKDTIKNNNHISNLEFLSIKDNNTHAREKISFNLLKGNKHHKFKLTDEMKDQIRELKKSRVPNKVIAKKFNIHEMTIYKIIKS